MREPQLCSACGTVHMPGACPPKEETMETKPAARFSKITELIPGTRAFREKQKREADRKKDLKVEDCLNDLLVIEIVEKKGVIKSSLSNELHALLRGFGLSDNDIAQRLAELRKERAESSVPLGRSRQRYHTPL